MNAATPAGAAILLNFVSGPESGGNYNVIYDHHERDPGMVPITTMQLDELLSAQIGWGRKWRSGAAGEYQLMQPTLADAMKGMGLSGSEIFTPDLQDRIGYWLLERRGYAAFKARQLSTVAFAKALAEEWASLPVLAPTQGAHRWLARGQSYYEADGLNHAGVTPEAFEAALSQALAAAT